MRSLGWIIPETRVGTRAVMRRGGAVAVSILAATIVTGCSTTAPSTTPSSSAPSPSGPTSGSAAKTAVPLSDTPSGTVTLSWDQSTKRITATLAMAGFTPSSAHAMHIHPGTCADQSQPPSVPFSDVTADASGQANQSVLSDAAVPSGIPTQSYVNIHLAPMASLGKPGDLSFTPIACADIPSGTPPAGPVTLTVKTPGKQGMPTGAGDISYNQNAHTLNVDITASGLPPNTAHAAHVHTGSCAKQGDVLYALPDLHADATGRAAMSTTIPNVTAAPPATGWYINIHFGPMSQILDTSGKPTLLFSPILCGNVKN